MGVPAQLNLYNNNLGPEGAKALAPAIAGSGSLTSVRVALLAPHFTALLNHLVSAAAQVDVGFNNGIGKKGALELIGVFKQKEMVSVGLASCGLGPEEAVAVADYIRGSASLTAVRAPWAPCFV